MLEVIERALLQALEQRAQVLVRGARAELVPARTDAAFQHRHDAAEVVGDDFEVRIFVHDLGEHQPRHRRRGLVGPAEGPPDFVSRFLLAGVVGEAGVARRMQPDRLVELLHRREKRLELRFIEWLAGNVGVDLHAERAVLDRAGRLADAGIGCVEGDLRHPAGEVVLVLGADLGEFIVDQLGVFVRLDAVALGEGFQRRHRVGQYLRIVLERIDHLLARIDIVDARHPAHALADIGITAVDQQLEHPARHEMGIGIDTHERLRN